MLQPPNLQEILSASVQLQKGVRRRNAKTDLIQGVGLCSRGLARQAISKQPATPQCELDLQSAGINSSEGNLHTTYCGLNENGSIDLWEVILLGSLALLESV